MHLYGADLVLSATDLSNFLGCRHRTALDMAVAHGERQRSFHHDPLLELLWQRGLEHERRFVDSLRASHVEVVNLGTIDNPAERVAATLGAMRNGTDVIVQGGLTEGRWYGQPDVMRRVSRASALGEWAYEVTDTKLARETRAGTILQLGLYSEMLAAAQGARPEEFHVVTPDALTPVHTYRVDDYAAYVRLIRRQMIETVEMDHRRIADDNYPEPVEHCEVCHWNGDCATKRRADDHLSLVANITRAQRRELVAQSVPTLTNLAGLAVPLTFKPKRGSIETYVAVREQARLQLASRGRTPPLHELLAVQADRGFCRLPEPSPGDLFLDLEGDPFAAEGGREYLFGLAKADGSYGAKWAFTDAGERRGFEWVMDAIADSARAHPGMHVYHYAPYEPAAFKRLMGRHATRERELDAMLRAGRFVDLYATVRHALRAGIERYSIKDLEPLYAFNRDVPLGEARRNLKLVELALEMGTPDSVPAAVRDAVEGYNRDDCVSTLRLRNWLEQLRTALVSLGTEVPRPVPGEGDAPAAVDAKAQRVEALRTRLLAGVPEIRDDRDADQQARWLLAYMLDYHRREDKASWWEYFRLRDLAEDDLYDEREAVAGMELVERLGHVISPKTGKPTKSVIDRYRYPAQEMEIDPGDEVRLQDQTKFADVVAVDRAGLTIDVEKGPSRAATHPSAMFAFSYVSSEAMETALFRIGEAIASDGGGFGAARTLLSAEPPRLRTHPFGKRATESEVDFAVRIGGDLDETVLAIQGPPGSGKTFCGAHMICELVRQGKKVGVTATGHKVIRNLLDAVANAAAGAQIPIRLGHKSKDATSHGDATRVAFIADNADALTALQQGDCNVVGGTAWLWARPEFASAVDVLFVDEAGQMSLPNVLAVSHAANSVVLLGDPQQLEQPRKGSHPDGVDVSALEHILRGQKTISADRGVFLPVTWRLSPAICGFTSELFYDGRLTSRDGLERQRIIGGRVEARSGLAFVDVVHDGNRNFSLEEIDIVADLVARFTDGATWVNGAGHELPVTGSDVLVVAPYNAHVSRLAARLAGTGVRVGTVDKFQGQEAPVVIYSMATSRPEDAPRGLEFLFSLNRLNVATSRARCVAVLVASPRLYEPDCGSPRQMKLANAMCRFREIALSTQHAANPSHSRA
ncbi:MAG: TM0106 family RecB-like putative nuclease [bacterium]